MAELKEIDEQIAKLQIEKNLLVEEGLSSNDPSEIFKAQSYVKETMANSKNRKGLKSFLFDPFDTYYSANGYKQTHKRVSFEVLKKVADTPVVGSIINTRIFQIQNFLRYTENSKEEGYTIRKKRWNNTSKIARAEQTDEDKRKIAYIVNFLENGGLKSKWEITDDLSNFTRKAIRDSLTYDQLAAECERNRRFELIGHNAIDASMIRILETVDPRFFEQSKQKYEMVLGHFPRYVQVFQQNPLKSEKTKEEVFFYPWELMYAQRNMSTALEKNGYGTSEVEVLLDLITWNLWGMQYNGNFFKQGSNPKGFINLKDDGVNMDVVNDFRQTWRQMTAGVQNSHKIPVFSGIDLEWIDLQGKNNDMEFQQWMEFLIIMMCSVFTIDPSELGYQFQKQAQIFGQAGQKERIQNSKKKGLKPLLLFWEKCLTKWIVSEIDSEYEMVFTGIDNSDEIEIIDIISKKLTAGIVSFESAFEAEMGRPYNEKTDTILNPTFLQVMQMKQMGGDQSNQSIDDMTEEEGANGPSPFDRYNQQQDANTGGFSKSQDRANDPIIKECLKYVEHNLA